MASSLKRVMELAITGDASGASKALKQASGDASKTASDHDNASKIIGNAMAVAGAAVLAFGLKSASVASRVGGETLQIQRYFGGTAEQASKLRAEAQLTGVSVDSLTKGFGKFSKSIEANPGLLNQFGLSAIDAAGNTKSLYDLLPEIADQFKSMPNGAAKTAEAMVLFGRSGADLIPFLNRGSEGLAELGKKAQDMGLVLSGPQLQAIKENKAAHREFGAALEGLQVQIGLHVLPVLTSLMNGAQHLIGPLTGLINPVTATVAGLLALSAVGMKVVAFMAPMWTGFMKLTETARTYLYVLIQDTIGMGAFAAAAAITVAAIAAVAVAYKLASDSASSVLKPEIEVGRANMLSESYDSLTDHIGRVKTVADDFGNDWNPIVRQSEGDVRKLQAYGEHIQGLADAVAEAAGITKDQALTWVQAQEALGRSYDTTSEAVSAYTGVVDTSNMSAADAAQAIQAQKQAIQDLNDELHAMMDPLFGMQKALTSNRDAQEKATQASVDAYLAQLNLDAVRKKYKDGSPEVIAAQDALTKATKDYDAASSAAAETAMNVSTAANILKGEMDRNGGSVQGAKDQLTEWVKQGLLTEDQAKKVAQQFGWASLMADVLGNKHPSPTVTTPGLDEAIRKFGTLADAYERLGKDVPVYMNPGAPAYGPRRAAGGPVQPYSTYIVHDTSSPEVLALDNGQSMLFTGASGGHITNLGDAGPLPSGSGAAAAAGQEGVTIVVQGSLLLERDLLGLLDKAKQSGYRPAWATLR